MEMTPQTIFAACFLYSCLSTLFNAFLDSRQVSRISATVSWPFNNIVLCLVQRAQGECGETEALGRVYHRGGLQEGPSLRIGSAQLLLRPLALQSGIQRVLPPPFRVAVAVGLVRTRGQFRVGWWRGRSSALSMRIYASQSLELSDLALGRLRTAQRSHRHPHFPPVLLLSHIRHRAEAWVQPRGECFR